MDRNEHQFARRSIIGEKAESDYGVIVELAVELIDYISLIDKMCEHNSGGYEWTWLRDSLIIIRGSTNKLNWK